MFDYDLYRLGALERHSKDDSSLMRRRVGVYKRSSLLCLFVHYDRMSTT